MGLLDKLKGFIKLSEVSADSAQALLDTAVREDANTVITQVTNALEDSLRKQSLLPVSTGNVTWSLNKLTPDVGTNITIKLLQNSNGLVVNLILNYADFSSGISFPNDGDILYIELNRSLITSGNITIYNGGGNTGQRAVVGSGLPPLVNNQTGGLQGTICIPVAIRQGTDLWWVQSRFYWSNGTTGFVGSIGTSSPIATGTIFAFSGQTSSVPSGYLLCDGSSVSPASYPALASLYWNSATGLYLYGGGTGVPGPTPSGNFNLPNTQGIFIRGAGSQIISGNTYTGIFTDKNIDTFKSHDHGGVTGNNNTSLNHSHAYYTVDNTDNPATRASGGRFPGTGSTQSTDGSGNLNHTHNISSEGGTETRPANIALHYIVKA